MSNPRATKKRFPYMFIGDQIELNFYKGWHPLLDKLCQDIDQLLGEDKRAFHWLQIKEKLGTIRLYWRMNDLATTTRLSVISTDGTSADFEIGGAKRQSSHDAKEQVLRSAIDTLIGEAETATSNICMACGSPGRQISFSGYIVTLCRDDARKRHKGLDPGYWFNASEGG